MISFSTLIKYKDRLLKTENRIIRMTQNSYYTSEVLGQLQVHYGIDNHMLGKKILDLHSKQLPQHQEFHILTLNLACLHS